MSRGRDTRASSGTEGGIVAADGLFLAMPEYNNSMPGVFKNAIDWLSRPPADIGRVFGGKPVAVLGASPSGFGSVLSQNAWQPVLRTLGTTPWCGGHLLVSRGGSISDGAGRLARRINQKKQAILRGHFVATNTRLKRRLSMHVRDNF